jgi:predicted transcriptional regulator
LQKLGYIPASVTSNRHQLMSGTQRLYRDRIYIVKDIILKLVQYGELNATSLISFCGLNFKKHMSIVDKGSYKQESAVSWEKTNNSIQTNSKRHRILQPYFRAL